MHKASAVKVLAAETKGNTGTSLGKKVAGSSPGHHTKIQEQVTSQISLKNYLFPASLVPSPEVRFINKCHLSPGTLSHRAESSDLSIHPLCVWLRLSQRYFPGGVYFVAVVSGKFHQKCPKRPPSVSLWDTIGKYHVFSQQSWGTDE